MNPSTPRHRVANVSRWKLAFWIAAFAGGAYLGYGIAYSLQLSGFGAFGAFFAVGLIVTILVILGVFAGILALDKRGRPAARAVVVVGVLLVVGVGLGWAVTPILGLGYRAPVVLETTGTMNVSLDGLDGFASRADAAAHCRSLPDSESVAIVEANEVGGIRTDTVVSSVSMPPDGVDGPAEVQISIQPAVKGNDAAPMWQGSTSLAQPVDGHLRGRIVFTGAALIAGEEDGTTPEGWPAALSGTVSWSCSDWVRP